MIFSPQRLSAERCMHIFRTQASQMASPSSPWDGCRENLLSWESHRALCWARTAFYIVFLLFRNHTWGFPIIERNDLDTVQRCFHSRCSWPDSGMAEIKITQFYVLLYLRQLAEACNSKRHTENRFGCHNLLTQIIGN